jgi:hypothetical protein
MEPRVSIFDKSYTVAGIYCCVLKSGIKIMYSHRSAVWSDKAKCQFVTLSTIEDKKFEQIHFLRDVHIKELIGKMGFIYGVDEIDIRYNDISVVWEITSVN